MKVNAQTREFLILQNITEDFYFIAILDGAKCKTLTEFMSRISKSFKFPSYFGGNLNALIECLNDLEWIGKPNYALIIENSAEFLTQEKYELKKHLIDILNDVATQWKNVPNYENEDQFRKKSSFVLKLL